MPQFLIRPFQLLLTPICALVALYASFCYGILYMQLGKVLETLIRVAPWTDPRKVQSRLSLASTATGNSSLRNCPSWRFSSEP
jgi:hypothetical protein